MTANEVSDLLAELIRIDSTTGSSGEREILDFVAAWFGAQPSSRIVRSTSGTDGLLAIGDTVDLSHPHLLLACHADVVPAGSVEAWTSPPFAPTVRARRMYGRGSSDMKAGLAAAMMATVRLHEQSVAVALALSVGEETGSRGAPALLDMLAAEPVEVAAVIIPESTGNRVVLGHRGALWLRVETRGVSAHGSTPSAGRNAILSLRDVLSRLDEVPLSGHPSLGAETLNVGTMSGGSVPNIVPDRCVAQIDHRTVTSDSADRITAWWRRQPEVEDVTVELDLAPVWTSPDDPWVRGLPGVAANVAAAYFTDASVFARSMPEVPMVVWGPGDPDAVHAVDESVPLDLVAQAVDLFVAAGHGWATLPG